MALPFSMIPEVAYGRQAEQTKKAEIFSRITFYISSGQSEANMNFEPKPRIWKIINQCQLYSLLSK